MVVGATRNAVSIVEFKLLFHEIGSITSLFNDVTASNLIKHTECHLQLNLNSSRRISFNRNVKKLHDFTLSRQNPYSIALSPTPVPLNHLPTNIARNREVAYQLL